jgi:UDP-N-acetylglucosamine--N-acetylmuramyl-(pentapeptide) pyrophosphoryl-undecaprenol N-acetylglucosamine transferase
VTAGLGETYVIAGGGTGGHLYPGIAIAEEMMRRRPGARIVFAGRGLPREKSIVERQGFTLVAVESGGVVGKSLSGRIAGVLLAVRGFFESMRILGRLKPKAVIGVGGYASFPMMLAAAVRRIPTLVQDQNAVPGLTNRIVGRLADRIAITFEATRRHFGGRGVLTGNPVRAEFARADRERARRRRAADPNARFHLLVFGGSQGARALNTAVVEALPHLAPRRARLRIVHGTGPGDLERVRAAYAAAGFEADVQPYLTAIRAAYEDADLVIARAGASTVSELAACGRAAILVPLPTAAHDHQTRNAEGFAAAGAALLMPETGLTGARLAAAVAELMDEPARLAAMEGAAARLARPDAAARIVDLVEELASW